MFLALSSSSSKNNTEKQSDIRVRSLLSMVKIVGHVHSVIIDCKDSF